jgi:hypothetical protein
MWPPGLAPPNAGSGDILATNHPLLAYIGSISPADGGKAAHGPLRREINSNPKAAGKACQKASVCEIKGKEMKQEITRQDEVLEPLVEEIPAVQPPFEIHLPPQGKGESGWYSITNNSDRHVVIFPPTDGNFSLDQFDFNEGQKTLPE